MSLLLYEFVLDCRQIAAFQNNSTTEVTRHENCVKTVDFLTPVKFRKGM